MEKVQKTLPTVAGYGILNTLWAIGTSAMAGPLSA